MNRSRVRANELPRNERALGVVPPSRVGRGRGRRDPRLLLLGLELAQVDELPLRREYVAHDLQRRFHPLPAREGRVEDLVPLDDRR